MATKTGRPYLLCQKVDVNEPENIETVQFQSIRDQSTHDSPKYSVNVKPISINYSIIMLVGGIVIVITTLANYNITKYDMTPSILIFLSVFLVLGIIYILFAITSIV